MGNDNPQFWGAVRHPTILFKGFGSAVHSGVQPVAVIMLPLLFSTAKNGQVDQLDHDQLINQQIPGSFTLFYCSTGFWTSVTNPSKHTKSRKHFDQLPWHLVYSLDCLTHERSISHSGVASSLWIYHYCPGWSVPVDHHQATLVHIDILKSMYLV